jgi:HD-GYP domain-containing protein (c-di-GMP phosphodiesterase class II)
MTAQPASAETPASDEVFTPVPVSTLELGTTLAFPIYEDRADRNVLLIAAGAVITAEVINRLHVRGASAVRVARTDLRAMAGAREGATSNDPFSASDATQDGPGIRPESLIYRVKPHGVNGYEPAQVRRFVESFEASLDRVGTFFDDLAATVGPADGVFKDVPARKIVEMVEDLDLFASLGVEPREDRYPSRHSLQTMMLALATGTTMGLTEPELMELGVGCLAHDAGMLLVDPDLWSEPRKLTDVERLEITKHPTAIYERIARHSEFTTGSRMVVYQMHERLNGRGYPRGRSGRQIHVLARIAAVADVFVALVSPRPHRRALLPYLAMETLIRQTRRGLFDPAAVRGLLRTIAMFPIGSHVLLSDGRVARVLRAQGDHYTRPIVNAWRVESPDEPPATIDLSGTPELQISRPLTRFEVIELGLDTDPTGR